MIEVRPSTVADLVAHCGSLPPVRVRAYTGLLDGEVIAIGGVAYLPNGAVLMFLDAQDVTRERAKVSLYKAAKKVIEDCKRRGVTQINAMPQVDIEAAERFLARLVIHLEDPDKRTLIYEE